MTKESLDATVKLLPSKCGCDERCLINLAHVNENLNFRDIDVLSKEFEAGDISLDSFVKALKGEE
jgi:hypothetical protein